MNSLVLPVHNIYRIASHCFPNDRIQGRFRDRVDLCVGIHTPGSCNGSSILQESMMVVCLIQIVRAKTHLRNALSIKPG